MALYPTRRSGIDIICGAAGDGSDQGVTWDREEFYYHRDACDRGVWLVKDDTPIALRANERALGGKNRDGLYYRTIGINGEDGIPNSGDEGVIRYRVDGDLNFAGRWSTVVPGSVAHAAYTAPLTFGTMTYHSSTPVAGQAVAGAVGDNGVPITNSTGHWRYGLIDPFGDELHTIQIAFDHSSWYVWGYIPPGQTVSNWVDQWSNADGFEERFIRNPKTPALIPAVTGKGQFYTTPLKNYRIPQAFRQTTYFAPYQGGGVSFTVRSWPGNTVHWRIVTDPADVVTPYTTEGTNSKTLTDAVFPDGVSHLQFYYDPAFIKTRRMIKNPDFAPGDPDWRILCFGTLAEYDDWKATQVNGNGLSAETGREWKRLYDGHSNGPDRPLWDTIRAAGSRRPYSRIIDHALLAYERGLDAKQTNAAGATQRTFREYAKEMLMYNVRRIDPIGVELNWTGDTIPCREIIDRGYRNVGPHYDLIFGRAILRDCYSNTHHPDGITPVEDFKLRDDIAGIAHEMMATTANILDYGMVGTNGIGQTSRNCGAIAAALAMPSYQTDYYGTSGADGTPAGDFPWCPFRDARHSWHDVYVKNNIPLPGYPNPAKRMGIEEDMCLPPVPGQEHVPGKGYRVNDKHSYFPDLSRSFGIGTTMIRRHDPSKEFPNYLGVLSEATEGRLYGTKLDNKKYGPGTTMSWAAYNYQFPSAAALGVARMMSEPPDSELSYNKMSTSGLMWFFFRPNFVAADSTPDPVIYPPSGAQSAGFEITISSPLTDAVNHYTTDGSPPDESDPTSVPVAGFAGTISVRSFAPGRAPSNIISATYTLLTTGVPATATDLFISTYVAS